MFPNHKQGFCAIILGCGLILWAAEAIAAPQHIVSANLCADQWVLELVEPDRITGLSPLAKDAAVSAHAEMAEGFATVKAEAEAIAMLHPDLVLIGTGQQTLAVMLSQLGIPTFAVEEPQTLEAVEQQSRRLGKALGVEEKGKKLAEKVKAARQKFPLCTSECKRSAVVWEGGYASGAESLPAELVRRAGGEVVPASGFLDSERLLALRLERLVTPTHYQGRARAGELFQHPVFSGLMRVPVDGAKMLCGDPSVVNILPVLMGAM
jgi:iron complex transport system substrate-binding protein